MSADSEGNGRAAGFSSPEEEALINLLRTADWLQREMQRRCKSFSAGDRVFLPS